MRFLALSAIALFVAGCSPEDAKIQPADDNEQLGPESKEPEATPNAGDVVTVSTPRVELGFGPGCMATGVGPADGLSILMQASNFLVDEEYAASLAAQVTLRDLDSGVDVPVDIGVENLWPFEDPTLQFDWEAPSWLSIQPISDLESGKWYELAVAELPSGTVFTEQGCGSRAIFYSGRLPVLSAAELGYYPDTPESVALKLWFSEPVSGSPTVLLQGSECEFLGIGWSERLLQYECFNVDVSSELRTDVVDIELVTAASDNAAIRNLDGDAMQALHFTFVSSQPTQTYWVWGNVGMY